MLVRNANKTMTAKNLKDSFYYKNSSNFCTFWRAG